MLRITRKCLAALQIAWAAAGLCACAEQGKPPGQLVVSLETDMAMPQQIDTIHISVLVRGQYRLDDDYFVGSSTDQLIPATLTLAAEDGSTQSVTVRVAGRKQSRWRTFREVTSVVPPDRTAIMRMPIQWLCDETVETVAVPDSAGFERTRPISKCGEGYACRAGTCVEAEVEVDTLPTFTPAQVFGGDADAARGACFDTVGCMAAGYVAVPDAACTIDRPAGDSVNVALRVVRDGICDTSGSMCFVPLDGDSEEGFVDSGRLQLPAAACDKLRDGLVRAVYVSTACKTKTPANPPCGFWSSVPWAQAIGPAPDLPPPKTPELITTVPLGNQRTLCCPLSGDGDKLYTCVCNAASKGDATLYQMTPLTGDHQPLTALHPPPTRQGLFFSATAWSGSLFWVADRNLQRTSLSSPAQEQSFALEGSLYEAASLLADTGGVYALANIDGNPTLPVQLVVLGPDAMLKTPLTTGEGRPVLQFDHDARAVYIAKDVDTTRTGMPRSFDRVSRVLRVPKDGSTPTQVLPDRKLVTDDISRGGYVGVRVDGTSLFTLVESAADPDGIVNVELLRVDLANPQSAAAPVPLYSAQIRPAATQIGLLGIVDGIAILARNDTIDRASGRQRHASLISVAPGVTRILADYSGDVPVVGMGQDAARIYWLNQSGLLYGLSRSALQ